MTAFTPQKGEAGWGSSHPLNMDYDILRVNRTWLSIYMESCFQSFQLQGPSACHRTQPGNQIPSLSTCLDFSFSHHIQTNPSKSSIDVSHQHHPASTQYSQPSPLFILSKGEDEVLVICRAAMQHLPGLRSRLDAGLDRCLSKQNLPLSTDQRIHLPRGKPSSLIHFAVS